MTKARRYFDEESPRKRQGAISAGKGHKEARVVAVFQIKRWNAAAGRYEMSLLKHTEESIAKMAAFDENLRPTIIPGTEEEVDPAKLDAHGRYDPHRDRSE